MGVKHQGIHPRICYGYNSEIPECQNVLLSNNRKLNLIPRPQYSTVGGRVRERGAMRKREGARERERGGGRDGERGG